MFKDNLISLRKMKRLSQEALAEQLGITRQTLSKWETGESSPDIERCLQIARLFDVSLDDLVSDDKSRYGLPLPPKGRHMFGMMKVGEKGQIVLPARARKIFGIQPGDHLFLLGDESAGLAIIKESDFLAFAEAVRKQADHKG